MANRNRTNTVGRRLLKRAIKGRGVTWLSKLCDVEQPSASAWVNGWSRPKDEHQAIIEEHLGIPRPSWKTAKERRLLVVKKEKSARVLAATGTGGG